ncbi:MAG: glutamate synthase subunit alpha, partial [Pirellulaceae bacterium]
MSNRLGFPEAQGLYDPSLEKDSCGVGFVANVKGIPSHQIVLDADHILRSMNHRGACGCEANTGDGAGILTALPDKFLRKTAKRSFGVELPKSGLYAVGNVFLPQDVHERAKCLEVVQAIVEANGQRWIGWRRVPTSAALANIGPTAKKAEPWIEQMFVGAADGIDQETFERKLFEIRKQASHRLRGDHSLSQRLLFYICSLSTRTIIYKGMLTPDQVLPYYSDLGDADYETHLAMVHSRFSTNT